jgi:FtsH-binding integral membrane protein
VQGGGGHHGGIQWGLKDADRADRMGFIKKVYSILAFQLALTAAGVCWFTVNTKNNCEIPRNELTGSSCEIDGYLFLKPGSTSWWVVTYWGWWVAALMIAIFVEIALICCRHLARKSPVNYILLAIFTICEAYSVSATCIYYAAQSPWVVIEAFCGTAAITLACTAYAFTTKNDFTYGGGFIWLIVTALMFMLIIMIITTFSYILYDLLIALMVFLLGMFLIHDTQLIVGKGKWRLSMDDYIIGALILYIDIITIFLYLLALFGKK